MTSIHELQKQSSKVFARQHSDSIPERIEAIKAQPISQYDKDTLARMFLRVIDLAAHMKLGEHDLLLLAEQRVKIDLMKLEANR